jgi:hypothetical protein
MSSSPGIIQNSKIVDFGGAGQPSQQPNENGSRPGSRPSSTSKALPAIPQQGQGGGSGNIGLVSSKTIKKSSSTTQDSTSIKDLSNEIERLSSDQRGDESDSNSKVSEFDKLMPRRKTVKAIASDALNIINSKSNTDKPRTKFNVGDFDLKRTLGTGSFGRVHLCKLKANGKYYALKVLRKNDIVKMKQVEHTLSEKSILEKLNMPFLVGMLGTFQDAAHIYFVLEYVQGGELFTFLRRSGVCSHYI